MTPSTAPSGETLPVVSVAFALAGGELDPDLVTARLGIEPTSLPGDGGPTPGGHGRGRRDRWMVRVGPRETLDVEDMLEELRGQLDVAAEELGRVGLELGLGATLLCELEPRPRLTPVITFNERVVAWACELGASICVELLPWRAANPEDPPEVSAALDLEGGPFDPDAVTAGLGVQPTTSYRAGDYLPPRPRPMRQDRWRIYVGPRETLDMEAMLAELRARLGVPAEAVRRVCSELGVRPSVYCPVSPTSGLLTEIALSREVVGWARDLGAEIGVDVMLWAEDEDEDCDDEPDEVLDGASDLPGSSPRSPDSEIEDPARDPAQDKPLTRGDIRRLKRAGWDPHDWKLREQGSDLYKDGRGNVYEKP